MPISAERKSLTTLDLVRMKAERQRIVALTCYDALHARILDEAGVDVVLVGDSVQQVVAGHDSTLGATLDQMIYHGAAVRRGLSRSLLVIDLPFLTYQVSVEEAIRNAGLGLNPMNEGNKQLRINVPALSGDRRKQLGAKVKQLGEDAKVTLRNARRDANKHADQLKAAGHTAEDEIETLKEEIQGLLKKYESEVDKLVDGKTKEIMEV